MTHCSSLANDKKEAVKSEMQLLTLIISTAFLMSRIPSYTRREASINSFSSIGWAGSELRASTAASTCSVKRGMTVEKGAQQMSWQHHSPDPPWITQLDRKRWGLWWRASASIYVRSIYGWNKCSILQQLNNSNHLSLQQRDWMVEGLDGWELGSETNLKPCLRIGPQVNSLTWG